MADAKVHSVDAIKLFRTAMIKFAESVNAALGNADSDVNRAQTWLDMEAKTYWANEIRKRQIALAHAQEALRMKTLYKNFDGTTPSAVDEKKAVIIAKQRLVIAEEKAAAVRKYSAIMQRESLLYKGSVQRFSTTIQSGTPVAIARLSRIMDAIDRYLAATPEVANVSGSTLGDPNSPNYLEFLHSMTRPEEEELNDKPAEDTEENAARPAGEPAAEPAPQTSAESPSEQPAEAKESS